MNLKKRSSVTTTVFREKQKHVRPKARARGIDAESMSCRRRTRVESTRVAACKRNRLRLSVTRREPHKSRRRSSAAENSLSPGEPQSRHRQRFLRRPARAPLEVRCAVFYVLFFFKLIFRDRTDMWRVFDHIVRSYRNNWSAGRVFIKTRRNRIYEPIGCLTKY